MTGEQISAALSKLKSDFDRSGDSAAARNALQEIFDECLFRVLFESEFNEPLEKAFSLLRKIENSALPQSREKYRYNAVTALESLCFCADLLSLENGAGVIFGSCSNTIYINAPQRQFLLSVSNLLANAVRNTVSQNVRVTLKSDNNNAFLFITNKGEFSYAEFQKAMLAQSSLGFAVRLFESSGGEAAISCLDGYTTVAVRLPLADGILPKKSVPAIDELLYDRLSVIYIAFCGH